MLPPMADLDGPATSESTKGVGVGKRGSGMTHANISLGLG